MKRATIAIGCLALASLSAAQDLSQKVSFSWPGKNARLAVEALSKQVNVPLAVGASLEFEPLIIRFTDKPLKELLDRIALAVDGEWKQDSLALRLVPKQATTQGDPRYAQEVERITKIQEETRKSLAKTKAFDAKAAGSLLEEIEAYFAKMQATTPDNPNRWEEGDKVGAKGPHQILAKRIFVTLDPKALARIITEKRVVFSTKPTRMQLPLPQAASNAVRQFQSEEQVWRNALGNKHFRMPNDYGLSTGVYQLLKGNLDDREEDEVERDQTIVKVIVSGQTFSGSLDQLQVSLVGKDGRYLTQSDFSLWSLQRESEQKPDSVAPKPPAKNPNEKPIKVSELSKLFLAGLRNRFEGNNDNNEPWPPEIENILLNPEKEDLSTIGLNEILQATADSFKVDMVVCPSDIASLYIPFMMMTEELTPSGFINMLATSRSGISAQVQNGYLTLTTSKTIIDGPLSFNTKRFDRKAIGSFARRVKAEGRMTIEAIAEYVYRSPEEEFAFSSPNFIYMAIISPEAQRMLQEDSMKALRLYGSLDPMQRRAIASKQPLTVNMLRPEQRAMLTKMVYGADRYRFQFQPVEKPNAADDWYSKAFQLFHEGIAGEPTERFPNGIPLQATLTFEDENGEVVEARGSENQYGSSTVTHMTAEDWGRQLAYRSMPGNENMQDHVNYNRFRIMNRRTLRIVIQLDPEVTMQNELTDLLGKSKSVNSWEELPAEFKQRAEKAKQDMIKQMPKNPPQVDPAN